MVLTQATRAPPAATLLSTLATNIAMQLIYLLQHLTLSTSNVPFTIIIVTAAKDVPHPVVFKYDNYYLLHIVFLNTFHTSSRSSTSFTSSSTSSSTNSSTSSTTSSTTSTTTQSPRLPSPTPSESREMGFIGIAPDTTLEMDWVLLTNDVAVFYVEWILDLTNSKAKVLDILQPQTSIPVLSSIGYLPGTNLAPKDIYLGVGLNNQLVILGTAPDGHLYTKKTLDSSLEWVPNSSCVSGTAQFDLGGPVGGDNGGPIYGVGSDNAIYQKPKEDLTANWVLIPNSNAVFNVAVGYLTE
ncbi:hypothetical protein BCR33DRAFT_787773 [Rhizoclosmatium globosum]|uniref:Uncharacterized protein n=1 Tax=Rhizoclosmatium globosum TaxID=329046 RepID=A0A1Y2BZR2_9FUNG|nr:hypothetical protein BCR33DRAFT_787773 [Rhizoclosmatium globosum]|eukprot:ORY40249.1 hypothetical protein BCR33DRAFT_787773 [Rhizoclosmatium globosum]